MPSSFMRAGNTAGAPVTSGGQRFVGAFANCGLSNGAAEATGSPAWPENGTFSKLTMTIKSNAISAGTNTKNTRFRKNLANGTQIVTATLGTLGVVTDLSNTDSVVAGDRVGILIGASSGAGGGTVTYTAVGTTYESSSYPALSVVMLGAGADLAANYTAGEFRYGIPWGSNRWNGVGPGSLSIRGISPIISSLTISASTSTVTAPITYASNINGSAGVQSVTIPATTTGYYQDLTNSEYVKPNDNVTITAFSTGTGATGIRVASMIYRDITGFQAAAGSDNAALGGIPITPGSTFYGTIAGSYTTTGTGTVESEVATHPNVTGLRARNFLVYISANTATATFTATLRIGSADSTQVLSVPAGSTGLFEDLSNSDAVGSTTAVAAKYELAGGSGSVSVYKVQTTWTQPSTVWSQGMAA